MKAFNKECNNNHFSSGENKRSINISYLVYGPVGCQSQTDRSWVFLGTSQHVAYIS